MSITDELRECIATAVWQYENDIKTAYIPKDKLTAIADCIDAEYEAMVSYWQGASYKDGYDEGFASADDWLADHEDAMAEHGWIRLPVDADGEVIHIGDVMDTEHFGTVEVEGFVHNAIAFYNYSGQLAYLCTSPANLCRHHRVPTVEDVLREFAEKITDSQIPNVHPTYEEAIAEYASKLRLAGEAE